MVMRNRITKWIKAIVSPFDQTSALAEHGSSTNGKAANRGLFHSSAMHIYFIFPTIGAFALACQTLIFREFLTSFRGNEFGVALFFSSWMFWIAIGAMFASYLNRHFQIGKLFILSLLLYPPIALLQTYLIINLRSLSSVEPFELFPLGDLFSVTLFFNSPLSTLSGFVFTSGCLFLSGIYSERTHRIRDLITKVYSLEALGSFFGGLLVTVFLWYSISSFTIFIILSISLYIVTFWIVLRKTARLSAFLLLSIFTGFLFVYYSPISKRVNRFSESIRWPSISQAAVLLESLETPYQKVNIAELNHQKLFITNGQITATSTEMNTERTNIALLFAQCPTAQKVLVIGFGSESIIPVLLQYNISKVDYVSNDRKYHQAVMPYYESRVTKAFEDPRVELFFTHPDEFIRKRNKYYYDIIWVDIPEPETTSLNRFYTVEFYQKLHYLLTPHGVLATMVTLGENYAGVETIQYGRSVYHSIDKVFSEVVITPGEYAWLFASPTKGVVSLSVPTLENRLQSMKIRDRQVSPKLLSSIIQPSRVEQSNRQFIRSKKPTEDALLNTEDKPVTLFLSLAVSIKEAGLTVGRVLIAARKIGLLIFVIPVLVMLVLRLYYRRTVRKRDQALAFNGAILLLLFGGISISSSILLLIAFQSRFGHLFISIGLLTSLFMLGLTLGSFSGKHFFTDIKQEAATWPAHTLLLLSCLLFGAFPFLVDAFKPASYSVALLGYHVLFLLTGIVCGVAFPVSSYYLNRTVQNKGWLAGLLESLDHWGATIGAAITGVFIIPILGLWHTCVLLVICLLAIWILFIGEQKAELGILSKVLRKVLPSTHGPTERHYPPSSTSGKVALITLGIVVSLGIISSLITRQLSTPQARLDPQWIQARFAVEDFQERDKPFYHFLLSDSTIQSKISSQPIGSSQKIVFSSLAVAPHIEGYGGPIDFLVVIDHKKRFHRVDLLKSQETLAYIKDLDIWLQQFQDWPLDKPIDLDDNVDAFTGATITARAATRILETARVRTLAEIYQQKTPHKKRYHFASWISNSSIAIAFAFLISVFLFLKGTLRQRLVLLLFNTVVIGYLFNMQFSTAHLYRIVTFQLPSLGNSGELFILVTGTILLSLSFGPIYCGYLCPFGALQELLGKLGLIRMPNREGGWVRQTKFYLLAALLGTGFIYPSIDISRFDPLQTVFSLEYDRRMILLLLVIAGFSLFYFRFFCRFLCPTGAFLALFNRLGFFLRLARPKRYAYCDLGTQNKWDIDCIQCNLCTSVKEKKRDTIRFSDDPTIQKNIYQRNSTKSGWPITAWLRDRWNILLLIGVGLTLFIGIQLEHPDSTHKTANPLGNARDIDIKEVDKLIREKRLSDHKALFYRVYINGAPKGKVEK